MKKTTFLMQVIRRSGGVGLATIEAESFQEAGIPIF